MFDVSTLKARKTTMPPRRGTRTKRDLGPNPWLDKDWEFNLKSSYDNAEPYELDFQGEEKDDTVRKGVKKGQPIKRLSGDAADAQTLIRDAADKLGLGVSVVVTPAVHTSGVNKGKPRAGWFTVKYQGQKRKAKKGTASTTA